MKLWIVAVSTIENPVRIFKMNGIMPEKELQKIVDSLKLEDGQEDSILCCRIEYDPEKLEEERAAVKLMTDMLLRGGYEVAVNTDDTMQRSLSVIEEVRYNRLMGSKDNIFELDAMRIRRCMGRLIIKYPWKTGWNKIH